VDRERERDLHSNAMKNTEKKKTFIEINKWKT
jgi:hypothetical protein